MGLISFLLPGYSTNSVLASFVLYFLHPCHNFEVGLLMNKAACRVVMPYTCKKGLLIDEETNKVLLNNCHMNYDLPYDRDQRSPSIGDRLAHAQTLLPVSVRWRLAGACADFVDIFLHISVMLNRREDIV